MVWECEISSVSGWGFTSLMRVVRVVAGVSQVAPGEAGGGCGDGPSRPHHVGLLRQPPRPPQVVALAHVHRLPAVPAGRSRDGRQEKWSIVSSISSDRVCVAPRGKPAPRTDPPPRAQRGRRQAATYPCSEMSWWFWVDPPTHEMFRRWVPPQSRASPSPRASTDAKVHSSRSKWFLTVAFISSSARGGVCTTR